MNKAVSEETPRVADGYIAEFTEEEMPYVLETLAKSRKQFRQGKYKPAEVALEEVRAKLTLQSRNHRGRRVAVARGI